MFWKMKKNQETKILKSHVEAAQREEEKLPKRERLVIIYRNIIFLMLLYEHKN